MSFDIDQSLNHYVPAAKHVYLFESNTCDDRLLYWIASDVQYILDTRFTTTNRFTDAVHFEKLFSDDDYFESHRSEYEEYLGLFLNARDEYAQVPPPYFCNPNVPRIHEAMLRMNDRHLGFYLALHTKDKEKAASRVKGLDDVILVILEDMSADPQMKPMLKQVTDSIKW